jgi:nucleoside-diphosphate-sugar epimerase
MKIFITGATGYIGFNVALALRRHGHEVHGLTRSPEKGTRLARNEILPVIGSMQKPAGFLDVAGGCDVLVHAAIDYEAETAKVDRSTVQALLGTGVRGTRPKTFVYTSGCWNYGSTGGAVADEETELHPSRLAASRPDTERIVIENTSVRGIVIRPGCVYGRRGGLTGPWFQPLDQNQPVVLIDGGRNKWAMVHVDDLAEGYRLACESGLKGEVFNLTDDTRFTVRQMAEAAIGAAGSGSTVQEISLEDAEKSMGDLAESLALDQQVSSGKAQNTLGWGPRHEGFIAGVDIYYESWKAHQA